MRLLRLPVLLLASLITPAAANVEKTIFTAPFASSALTYKPPGPLLRLSDTSRTLAATLNTSFAAAGFEHWVELSSLQPSSRYELRICWPATMPTDFELDVMAPPWDSSKAEEGEGDGYGESKLYVRITATAAYWTDNERRMEVPDVVEVDLILDRFWAGVLPESLLRIGAWVVAVAVFAWWFGGVAGRGLTGIGAMDEGVRGGKKTR